jgi:hypothetical protein
MTPSSAPAPPGETQRPGMRFGDPLVAKYTYRDAMAERLLRERAAGMADLLSTGRACTKQ